MVLLSFSTPRPWWQLAVFCVVLGAGGPISLVGLDFAPLSGLHVHALCEQGLVQACHDLSDGGLYVALAEMALAAGIGADLTLPEDCESPMAWLFGEDQGRYLLAVAPDRLASLEAMAGRVGVLARQVGTTGGAALTLAGRDAISLQELGRIHSGWLPAFMGTP